jgi:predicted nucleotidyltransferase
MKTLATDALHLPAAYLSMVRDMLSRHAPNAEVWAYGSRVAGTGHHTSDLDLVLRNPAHLDVETGDLGALTDAFSEGNLPIRVDLTDWARIPEHFRQEITRAHVVVQPGTHRYTHNSVPKIPSGLHPNQVSESEKPE